MEMRGGIDLGGTKIQAVIVDADSEVRGRARHDTPTTGGPEDVAAAMAGALREAAGEADVGPADLRGVGVGAPGAIDGEAGTLSHPPNLPGWERPFPLARVLGDALGTDVRLGNDVTVATRAEFELGAARPYRSTLGVFWGTGVGGGIILDGESWVGRGAAGEIGHTVVRIGGRRCGCGRLGCLEAYSGRGAMEREARRQVEGGRPTALFEIMERRRKTRLASGVWEEALRRGDPLARELIAEAVDALGAGVASAVNLLDVGAVVIGGGLGTRFGQPMADRILEAMRPHLFVDENPPAVHVAALGDLGGAVGAALLVAEPAAQRVP